MSIKSPTDALGNTLVEGNLVRVALTEPAVVGRIVQLQTGGLDVPSYKNKTPGQIVIQVVLPMTFPEGAQIMSLMRLVDPQEQDMVEKIVGPMLVDKSNPQ